MTIRSMKWAAGVSLFAAVLAVGTTLPERQASAQVQAVPRAGLAFNDTTTQRVTIELVDPEGRTVVFTLPDGQLVAVPVASIGVHGSDTETLRASLKPYAGRVTTISSPRDLVAPPAVCCIDGATNVILSTVPRRDETLASHIGVIFMHTVVQIVLASLMRSVDGSTHVRFAV